MNEPQIPGHGPKPKNTVFIALPGGEMIDALEFMKHQREREASMGINLLTNGDVIAFQYEDPEDDARRGFTYEVEEAGWSDVGIGREPNVSVSGKLQGPHLHPAVVGKTARFVGSGFGGSMIQPGTIATGRAPSFFIPDEGEYPAPFITNFEVFRPDDEGNLRPMGSNELDSEARIKMPEHAPRLKKIEELMSLFDFGEYRDFDRRTTAEDVQVYEDERYAAEFDASGGQGNTLGVYDKHTGQWMGFRYFGAGNEDILQVAYSDLSGHERSEVFSSYGHPRNHTTNTSDIHNSGEAIITYVTSSRYGLEAIHYDPSDNESLELLGVPLEERDDISHRDILRPAFETLGGSETTVPRHWYLDDWELKHPGFYDRLEGIVSLEVSEEGATLIMNDQVVKLKDPDAELDTIIHTLKNPGQITRRHKAAKTAGRFIRPRGREQK